MQDSTTPYRHALATHAAGTVLGYRRNGAPIYAIAGGSTPAEPTAPTAAAPAAPAAAPVPAAPTTPAAAAPAAPAPTPAKGDDDGTDWKAHAREWEKRAKANTAELEKLRQATMTDQERAVSEAEAKGRTAAAAEYGSRLAAAEFRAAAATAGVQLGDAADLIDMGKFVGADGSVDSDAITAAVAKLGKLAPAPAAGRSGTPTPPAGSTTPAPQRPRSIAQAVARTLGAGG